MVAAFENELSKKIGPVPPSLFFENETLADLADDLLEEKHQAIASYFEVDPEDSLEKPQQNGPTEKLPGIKAGGSPTGGSRAAQFLAKHGKQPTRPDRQGQNDLPEPADGNQPIAVIGLAGRYPGAKDLQAFWENLKQGVSSISEVPNDRWDVQELAQMGVDGRWGAFLEGIDQFDPLFFRVAPNEAVAMDPHERLFLQSAWAAIEDAGYNLNRLATYQEQTQKGIGLYLGGMYHNYHLLAEDPVMQAQLACSSFWVLANRVSHFFNLQGPSFAIESACSASLSAIIMGCEALRRGEASMVLAGGVNLQLHPGNYLSLKTTGALGTSPKSKAMGDSDGYLPGEGVGVVVLKPLNRALADGDRVYGVIRGGGMNHSGRTLQFGIPQPALQVRLIQRALDQAGLKPDQIDAVEVAANGSNLGDAIEIQALRKVFSGKTTTAVRLSSVKSNIGHLEAASGISQLTKVLLQFKHQTWVPTLHSQPLNPKIQLEGSPLELQLQAAPFEGTQPKRVLIDSFGFGGAYASAVVESFTDTRKTIEVPGPHLLVLSARNQNRLEAQARQLCQFLAETTQQTLDLGRLSWTLQAGREAFQKRLAFMAYDRDDAITTLKRYLEGDQTCVMLGDAKKDADQYALVLDGPAGGQYLGMLMTSGELEKLGRFWVSGVAIDWMARFQEGQAPLMMSLPTYPFEQRRFWPREGAFRFGDAPKTMAISSPSSDDLNQPLSQTVSFEQPVADDTHASQAQSLPEPKTKLAQIERRLSELTANFLEMELNELDPEADLSDFGLNSINTMRLLSLVQDHFDFQLERSAIYQLQNLRDFAEYLEENHDLDPTRFPALVVAKTPPEDRPKISRSTSQRSGSGVFGMDVLAKPKLEAKTLPFSECQPAFRMFEKQAQTQPQAVAIHFGTQPMSYKSLNALANQIARALVARQLGEGARIGVCLNRTPQLVASILAIHKIGAAYVPLDPQYPASRLQYIAEDSAMDACIIENTVKKRLSLGTLQLLDLDQESASLERFSGSDGPRVNVTSQSISHLIYTSGSTGKPKGVTISHGNVEGLLTWASNYFQADLKWGVLASTSVCFDLSVYEILWPLSCGGSMVLLDNLLALADSPLSGEVCLINTVPSAMNELLLLGELPQNIRAINLAGEPFTSQLVDGLYAQAGVREVHNLYGPSEDTTYSTGALLTPGSNDSPTIGKAIEGTNSWLINDAGNLVEKGEVGEIYLTGLGLSSGYWNKASRTASSFVPDCVSGASGGRMYATGDLAKERPNGDLEFLGRRDHQVKIRGFRIELGEIETVLEAHPDIVRAIVHPQQLSHGAPELVAYLQKDADSSVGVERLRELVGEKLPNYMVPTHWMFLQSLPRMANGKIDRKKLPQPSFQRDQLDQGFQAPTTENQHLLCRIWQDVLGIEQIGINDSFVQLGGHSLKAVKILARLRHHHGYRLSVRQLLPATTIASLSPILDQMTAVGKSTSSVPTALADRTQPLPLSSAQKRLWLVNQLHNGDLDGYHLCHGLALSGQLNVSALEKACQALVKRHEPLRTVFQEENGTPRQRILQSISMPFENLDWRTKPNPEQQLDKLLMTIASTPFNLKTGPLFKAHLVQIHDSEWLLLLALHHIVTDGWSMQVLERDLFTAYQAIVAGHQAALPQLELQYADVASWVQVQQTQAEQTVLEQYWTARLADVDPVLAWHSAPTSKIDEPLAKGKKIFFEIPQALQAQLTAFCETQERAPSEVLLAVFKTLVFCYTGRKDFVIGLPVANRQIPQTEPLVGFFINMLAHRTEVWEGLTFQQLLQQSTKALSEDLDHQDIAFETVVEKLCHNRDLTKMPLVQTVFNYQTLSHEQFSAGDLEISRCQLDPGYAHFDLVLDLTAIQPGNQLEKLQGFVEFNLGQFSERFIEQTIGAYLRFLERCLANPNQQIQREWLLDSRSRKALLELSSGAANGAHQARLVPEEIVAVAAKNPNLLACESPEGSLTYGQLIGAARFYAKVLHEKGIGHEQIVAVLCGRRAESLVAALAAWMVGAAYLPIDPALPEGRINLMLQEANAQLVMDLKDPTLPGSCDLQVIGLDLSLDFSSATYQPASIDPDQLAYLIFTSGSTGTPKAVMIPHKGLRHLVTWHLERYPLGEGSRASWLAGTGFDASVWEIWPVLAAGASLYWPSPDTVLEPEPLVAWFKEKQIQFAFCATPLAEALLNLDLSSLSLEHLLTGGDRLHLRPKTSLKTTLTNHYGPTESSVVATLGEVAAVGSQLPGIGKPVANTQAFILSETLRLLPVGLAGELYLGGMGLARGYYGQPGLTAAAFLPNGVTHDQPGSRIYKTGDKVLRESSGELHFIGRVDKQIQLRGFRIELGEIEACLRRLDGVDQAVVTIVGEGETAQLVAYYSLKATSSHQGDTAHQWLSDALHQHLPAYMVPSVFVTLQQFPMTTNGKIDRRNLPQPDQTALMTGRTAESPLEKQLTHLWEELLGCKVPSVDLHFFSLGGHSLLAAKMVSQMRPQWPAMTMRTLFQNPTIGKLASVLGEAVPATKPSLVLPKRPAELPASIEQHGLWLDHCMDPSSTAYNVPLFFQVSGSLDLAALNQATQMVLENHEVLRTIFSEKHGQTIQIVQKAGENPWVELDLTDEGDVAARLERHITACSNVQFDLSKGPLYKFTWIKTGEASGVLSLIFHHSIIDGWSVEVVLKALSKAYHAVLTGNSRLIAPTVQFADVALWQRQKVQNGTMANSVAFWKELLTGTDTILNLPTDRPRPAKQSLEGQMLSVAVPNETVEKLVAVCKQWQVTPFVAMLAACAVWLGRLSGRRDYLLGLPMALSYRAEFENLVGLLVNTLPLRVNMKHNPSFAEWVRELDHLRTSLLDHNDVSFDMLVDALEAPRDGSRNPLVQTMFSYRPKSMVEMSLDGLVLEPYSFDRGKSQLDLTLEILESLDQPHPELDIHIEYTAKLFDQATIEVWGQWFVTILEDALAHPNQHLDTLGHNAANENRVLSHGPQFNYLENGLVTEQLEKQVLASPKKFALVAPAHGAITRQTLSYAAFNKKVNQLAHYLRTCGVGPEVPVVVYMPTSMNLSICMWAVFKAGGILVPIDPGHGEGRHHDVLHDVEADVLLFQGGKCPDYAFRHTLDVDQMDAILEKQPSVNPEWPIAEQTTAYIIHTSGTTGKPKGVCISHRALANYVGHFAKRFELGPEDAHLTFASPSFDASLEELVSPLTVGSRLVIKPPRLMTPGECCELMAAEKITTLSLPTAYWHIWCSQIGELKQAPHLRLLVVGGEKAEANALKAWCAHYPKATWVNAYGPTETTISSSWWVWEPNGQGFDQNTIPIGSPVANTTMLVADQWLHSAPQGTPGEVLIGGVGLASGYWKRPGETAQKFLPHPLSTEPGARLYKTGDLGVYKQASESFFYVGRNDRQVKLRGYRMELNDIEQQLNAYPDLKQSMVLVVGDESEQQRLVALVSGDLTQDLPADESAILLPLGERSVELLDAYLNDRLPVFMVPDQWMLVQRWPLTPNGKVDVAQLRHALENQSMSSQKGVPITAHHEQMVAKCWNEVFPNQDLFRSSHFFKLGGNSLLATQLIKTLEKTFNMSLRVGFIFDHPTLCSQANGLLDLVAKNYRVTSKGDKSETAPELRIPKEDKTYLLPPSQRRLWLLEKMNPSKTAYNMCFGLRIEGMCDPQLLEESFKELIRRHDSMRTYFLLDSEEPLGIVKDQVPFELVLGDLSNLPEKAKTAAKAIWIKQKQEYFMQLNQAPLLMVSYLKLSQTDVVALVLTHHLVFDGVSWFLLQDQLLKIYSGLAEAKSNGLGQAPSFRVYANELADSLHNLKQQTQNAAKRLMATPPVLNLPHDFPRPSSPTGKGEGHSKMLDKRTNQKLEKLAQDNIWTPFMIYLAATQVVLAKFSDQNQFMVGIPFANRKTTEDQGLVGMLVETLCVRADIDENMSFRQLVDQVRNEWLDTLTYAHIPFESIVEAVNPPRTFGQHPLFQVTFNFLPSEEQDDVVVSGFKIRDEDLGDTVSHFDMTFGVVKMPDRTELSCSGSNDLFEKETVGDMLATWALLLKQAARFPNKPLKSLLAASTKLSLAPQYQGTPVKVASEETLATRFLHAVAATPDRLAIADEHQCLTYDMLGRAVKANAANLQQQGVQLESKVALWAGRNVATYVGFWSIVLSGGVPVPIDPEQPIERTNLMVKDASADFFLDPLNDATLTVPQGLQIEVVKQPSQELLQAWVQPPAISDALAYVIFTSGSTGRPKGVGVSHGSAITFFNCHSVLVDRQNEEASLIGFNGSFVFDGAVQSWCRVLDNQSIIWVPKDVRRNGEQFLAYIHQWRIQVLDGTPTSLRLLWEAGLGNGRLPLRTAFIGGEAILPDLWNGLARIPKLESFNVYGPTECTVNSTAQKLMLGETPHLGNGLQGVALMVRDTHHHGVQKGVPGELLIGGPRVARGYLGRPSLTAERFIPDAESSIPGARAYATGDLVRCGSQNQLQFIGRIDHQVKLHGYRLELGEIEAKISAVQGVSQVAVLLREDQPGLKRLVAYIGMSKDGVEEELRETLKQTLTDSLPHYMVPSVYVFLDQLPTNASGKINRKVLPAPDKSPTKRETAMTHEHGFSEILAELWATFLGTPPTHATMHFFEAGGHSLLASQFIAKCRQTFKIELPVKTIFETPTFEGLLNKIITGLFSRKSKSESQKQARLVIEKADRRMTLPLSFAQQRLWFLDKLEPGLAVYNIPFGLYLEGPFCLNTCEHAVREIIQRHEVFRTTFGALGSQPVQVIHDTIEFHIQAFDLSALEGDLDAVIGKLLADIAESTFNVPDGPHLRVVVLRVSSTEHYLMVNVHHIAFDGWSSGLFMKDFAHFYQTGIKNETSDLPALPLQYADFANWQRQWLRGRNLKKQLSFWENYLKGAPTILDLETDRPRPKNMTFVGGNYGIDFGQDLSNAVWSLTKGHTYTPFMVTLAGFNVLLRVLTGGDDFLVGTPIANRHHPQVGEIIGFFANTLVVRTKLSDGVSFRGLLDEFQISLTDAYDHQDLPFDKLVEALNPDRDLARSVLFQVMFAFQNLPDGSVEFEGVNGQSIGMGAGVSRFEMNWAFGDYDGCIQGGVEYNTDLFDESSIAVMADSYLQIMKACLQDPDRPIDEVISSLGAVDQPEDPQTALALAGYWKAKFATQPTVMEIPELQLPSHAETTHHGSICLEQERVSELEAAAKKLQVPVRALVTTAWASVLQRVCQQADWTLAWMLTDSEGEGSQTMLPLRIADLTWTSVAHGCDQMNTALQEGADHSMPLAELLTLVEDSCGLEQAEFAKLGFVWHQNEKAFEAGNAAIPAACNWELTLHAFQDQKLHLKIQHTHKDGFQTGLLALELLKCGLHSLANGYEKDWGRLPIQTSFEEEAESLFWNPPHASFENKIGIIGLFEAQVEKTPQAKALQVADAVWSYETLNQRANQIAHELIAKGIQPGDRIGIRLYRDSHLIPALLAVLKTGAAYVPIDPKYPVDRQMFMSTDGQVALELTSWDLKDDLDGEVPQIALDAAEKIIAERPTHNPPRPGNLQDSLAYVIYTSGSTGRPKGVAMTHGNASALLDWSGKHFQSEDFAGVLAGTSICFDLSIFEIFMPLSVGGSIILVENILDWDQTDASDQITLINTVPSAMEQLLKQGELPENLRVVNLAGEPFEQRLIVDIYANSGCSRVYNLYGPSEDTTYSTWALMPEDPEFQPHIGGPISHSQGYVLDRLAEPAPCGTTGELCLGGSGVAQGYLQRPKITAEKFIPNPFSNRPGARLYKTGDIVRRLPGGALFFLGRVDHQVKIRGFRIELGEIQTILGKQPGVDKALVTVFENEGDRRLVAYLQGEEDAVNLDMVQEELNEALPEYMVPSFWIVLQQFPLTPNGKIDRKKLPDPTEGLRDASSKVVPPANAIETRMLALWQEILKLPQISTDANFFKLGGHSLLATQLISRIRDIFGVTLPLKAVFQHPTIAGLCTLIEPQDGVEKPEETDTSQPEFEITLLERPETLPLSFSQQRLWFIDRLQPGNPAYNIPLNIVFNSAINQSAMAQALQFMVNRHESLRTIFGETNGIAFQEIHPTCELELGYRDLSDENDAQAALENFARDVSLTRFDLEKGPLLACHLVKLDENQYALISCIHHIIFDGVSSGIFVNELLGAYQTFVKGAKPEFPELPLQYADYAVWQRNTVKEERLEAQLNYWREKIGTQMPQLELPYDYSRPKVQSFRGGRLFFQIEEEKTQALRQLAQSEGATLFMVLLAAFKVLLSRYAGQQDIIVGSPIAGRQNSQLEPVVGFFVNHLALRTSVEGEPSFREVLRRVVTTTLDAYANQDLPFDRLVEEIQPTRDASRNPIYQTQFLLNNHPTPGKDVDDLDLFLISVEQGISHVDLTLAMGELEQGLSGSFIYCLDLFTQASVERMREHFKQLVDAILENPDQHLPHLNWLPPEESQLVIKTWNKTETTYPEFNFLHQPFEQRAASDPDETALVFEGEEWSYGELNIKANQLANLLQEQGVGPEVLVGVCMHRSLELVLSLYAILKAGGIYVPMDPDYPEERLNYMLEDADVHVLLTQDSLVENLPETAEIIAVDRLDFEALPSEQPFAGWGGEQAAYMIYTSGSTGKPKGVLNRHSSILNRLQWMQEAYNLNESDRVLQKTPFSFDVSVWEFFWPLMYGATLVIAPAGAHRESEVLIDLIVDEHVTTMHFVPSMLQMFLENPDASICKGLRRVICSGEALPATLRDRFFANLPHVELHNLYGPTEAAIDVTYWHCDPENRQYEVPIGMPIANTQIYILDRHNYPLAIGLSGELHIAGVNLGRGYKGRPALTAEKFVPDPFATVPGARAYKTGDLVQWQPDGAIAYVGRIDHQVKLRGFRIELGEIEAALCSAEGVAAAVVIVDQDSNGQQRLLGYLLAEQQAGAGAVVDAKALNQYLRDQLPDYMVPNFLMVLDSFPTTPNGKVDRKALPEPNATPVVDETFEEPRPGTERILAAIWEAILKIKPVGATVSFFDLGGHSLLVIPMLEEVYKEFEVKLPVATLFEYTTVRDLAGLIDEKVLESRPSPLITLQKKGDKLPLFFVHAVGGHLLSYTELARHFSKDRPLHAFELTKITGNPSIRDLAAYYVSVLRKKQPQGPYHLGGWSLGGVLAQEMARQLKSAGETLGMVALVDSWVRFDELLASTHRETRHAVIYASELNGRYNVDFFVSHEELVVLDYEEKYQLIMERFQKQMPISSQFERDMLRQIYDVTGYFIEGTYDYEIKPYDGDLCVFIAEQVPPDSKELANEGLGWADHAVRPLTLERVPGNHVTMLHRPQVHALIDALERHMSLAEKNLEEKNQQHKDPS